MRLRCFAAIVLMWIGMALHNHPESWPAEKVLAACKGHCRLMGSCADTGHWMRNNLVPTDMLKLLAGRVLQVHFKDLNEFGDGRGGYADCRDVPWGTGKGNAPGILRELKRQGFQGYCAIEHEDATPEELAKALPQCVRFFDQAAAELVK